MNFTNIREEIQYIINKTTISPFYSAAFATTSAHCRPSAKTTRTAYMPVGIFSKEMRISNSRNVNEGPTPDDHQSSGQGSRNDAHEAFWHLEPSKLNQPLVLWDSRSGGGQRGQAVFVKR